MPWIDDNTAAQEVLNAGLHGTALGSKNVTNAAWDNDSDELGLPTGVMYLHIATDVDVFLITNSSTEDPAKYPAYYQADSVYKIECRGHTKLHYRGVSTTGTIYVTAFTR